MKGCFKIMTTINKKELGSKIAERHGVTKKDGEAIVTELFQDIIDGLANGDKVVIDKFGAFEVVERAERKGRNPQTREEIIIPAKNAPKFKARKELKEAVL